MGFTLVELMIAMFIMAVVIVQVLAVMMSQEQSYYAQKRALETQTDARLIADMVMRDVRASGFMLPRMVGISSRDGGNTNPDVLCTSNPAAISETMLTGADDRFGGAPLATALSSGGTLGVDDTNKDIDGDGTDDFVVGEGIIISDGTRTHCARIQSLGSDTIVFLPPTSGAWGTTTPGAVAVPAVIYQLSGSNLTRNTDLLSPLVEDFQVEFAVDGTGFPVHDLNASGSVGIQGMRLSVLARTATPDPDLTTPGRQDVANRDGSGTPDSFRRRLVSVAAAPMNLL